MRRFPFIALALILVSCTRAGDISQDPLLNPLVMEQQEAELIEHLVNMQIRNDPSMADSVIKRAVDRERAAAVARSQEASQKVRAGIIGNFQSVGEEAHGTALMTDGGLYFSTDFIVAPGIDVHVYLTSAVDPRDLPSFPDATAIDLGQLRTPYGAQAYATPNMLKMVDGSGAVLETEETFDHTTVVLFDDGIGRMHGFAQLRP